MNMHYSGFLDHLSSHLIPPPSKKKKSRMCLWVCLCYTSVNNPVGEYIDRHL